MPSRPVMSRWVEQLQSRGRYTFTRAQVEAETARSFVAVQTALRRLKEQGRIVSPRRGFYVVVPPEYRASGSPPASWFIDELMRYLGQPYYVALLSAAAFHGAAHQQPMVFQVMTDKPTREMKAGKLAIQFSMSSYVEQMPVIEKQTETGTMRVATPETTAFDLVRYQVGAGHLSNAATVLLELSESIDPQALVRIAPLVRLPDVQRLGFLLDKVGKGDIAEPLATWLKTRRPRPIPLRPGESANIQIDKRWHLLPNEKLEVDL
ncbi:MAG: type IV toxin-antitoxin system AbiEi family antitoxin [Deltaproteobacteria bacterium]|nr:type IV toxin-antitoxin system AbiEi family antitoxin [Deltaproteobacteria bacterium]